MGVQLLLVTSLRHHHNLQTTLSCWCHYYIIPRGTQYIHFSEINCFDQINIHHKLQNIFIHRIVYVQYGLQGKCLEPELSSISASPFCQHCSWTYGHCWSWSGPTNCHRGWSIQASVWHQMCTMYNWLGWVDQKYSAVMSFFIITYHGSHLLPLWVEAQPDGLMVLCCLVAKMLLGDLVLVQLTTLCITAVFLWCLPIGANSLVCGPNFSHY